MTHKQSGFTLIELIVVIVILGVLAVTAAPKFLNLSADAHKAVLEQISVSVKAANKLLNVKSHLPSYTLVQPVASRSDMFDVDLDNDGSITDTDVRLINGYIDNTDIHKLIDLDDEFVISYDNPEFTYIGYDLDGNGSSINDNCYFRYTQAASDSIPPVYEVNTDGC